jgi:sialic acid synthase SpsE
MKNNLFEDLFVLELANNHWGSLERGLSIVQQFSDVVRSNQVKAAIKLQFRDVDTFVHKDYKDRKDIRYIKKTLDTRMSYEDLGKLTKAIRESGCIVMATPFDEKSVETCVDLGVEIIKLASSDINDWVLIRKIAETSKPVIFSTGGSSLADIDNLVAYFKERNTPIAINHCVSIYPSEDHDLEMNQINFLKDRYPDHVVGFSTHEYKDWTTTMFIAYAKGARTFERHIDIEADGIPVSPYCSLPQQIDEWFKAFHRVKTISGGSSSVKRKPPQKEIEYLDALVRGVYAKKGLQPGKILGEEDVYFAVPLQKGQMSCRDFRGQHSLLSSCSEDEPIMIHNVEQFTNNINILEMANQRGLS